MQPARHALTLLVAFGLTGALVVASPPAGPTSALDDAADPVRARADDDEPQGQDLGAPSPNVELPGLTSVDRATRRALDEGLAWLAERQRSTADGALPSDGAVSSRWAPVGVTALGTLAFLADGHPPGRGRYGAEVAELVDMLANLTDLGASSPTRGYIARQGDSVSRTHGHGYATLALAQAYGMSRGDERLGRILEAAVARIQNSQGAEGGWGYDPQVVAFHEGSVTITYAQALRAARNAGLRVDDAVIVRADDYVRASQKDDGTFRYMLEDERSSIALTAAAIGTLNATGSYDDPAIRSGIDAIFRGLDRLAEDGEEEDFPFYMRLYLAQALWQLSDPGPFERWWETERKAILRSQRADGSWGGSPYGDCYATAVHCLVLSVPEGVLPIFQR